MQAGRERASSTYCRYGQAKAAPGITRFPESDSVIRHEILGMCRASSPARLLPNVADQSRVPVLGSRCIRVRSRVRPKTLKPSAKPGLNITVLALANLPPRAMG